jgi:hypothetical protein
MRRAIVATLFVIAASTNLSANAAFDPRKATIHATIERSGTRAEWINNGSACRLISFIPLKLAGQKAAVVIDTLSRNGNAIALKQIKFNIHYNSQISKHVDPDVVLQVEDDAGNRSEQRYTKKDIKTDGETWTLKFDQPKKIRHVFVGGQQLEYRKEHSNLMGALDFTFSGFSGDFADSNQPMHGDIKTSVRVINPGEDPLLKLLTGTIESENPK